MQIDLQFDLVILKTIVQEFRILNYLLFDGIIDVSKNNVLPYAFS